MIRAFLLGLLALSLLLTGCFAGKEANVATEQKKLVLYSELDKKFTEDIVQAYNEIKKDEVILQPLYELKNGSPEPDLVLAEQGTLHGLKLDALLAPVSFPTGDRLPEKFRDSELAWYGVFFDPVVFLVNQEYSRKIGQKNLCGWADLENLADVRIAMENLSDSNSTKNFLGAFADHYGETTSLNYLWNINHNISKYAQFPFTPVRITAVGDTDVAITRQSYVFKYLEIRFPAYVVLPEEGTPVNLFGVAMFRSCKQDVAATAFMEWLIAEDRLKAISQKNNTGYMFLLPRGVADRAANPDKIWLNKNYLTVAEQDALTDKWLERVRFSR